MKEKFTQLLAKIETDQDLGEKLFSLETAEEVQSLLKEEGLDLTLEELSELKDFLIKVVENDELSDEVLDGVAGGSLFNDLHKGYKKELNKFQREAKPVLRRISDSRW